MIARIILSIVVAVATGILVKIVGAALLDAGVAHVGTYLTGVAVLLGILAGIWFYFASPYPTRRV